MFIPNILQLYFFSKIFKPEFLIYRRNENHNIDISMTLFLYVNHEYQLTHGWRTRSEIVSSNPELVTQNTIKSVFVGSALSNKL